MGFFVKFWGTRGSIPTPGPHTRKYGGNTSCVEVRVDNALFICDGGTGLRELGLDLMRRGQKNLNGHFLFSHTHWDHIQGFPFFVPVYIPGNTFTVYGTQDGDRRIHELLSGQMRSDYFPVNFADLRASIVASDLGPADRTIEGVRVRCLEQQHPGRSFAFSFEAMGHKVVYATDSEIDLLFPNPEDVTKNLDRPRPIPASHLEFCQGADLLIADAQYTDREYITKIGWGHARCSTVTDLAVQAGVKQLALYHHDPMQSDEDMEAKLGMCRQRAAAFGSKVVVFGAREGMELRIN